MFERLICQQNLEEFLGPSLLGRYKVRNGYANSVTRFIHRALRSYAVTQLRILYPTASAPFITARRSGCCIVFGVSVCLSVRPLKIIDFISTGPFDLFRVHFEFVCLFVCPSRCLSVAFGPFNGLRLTL